MMDGRFVCQEQLEEFRIYGALWTPFVDQMLGSRRYVRIHIGRKTFDIRLKKDSTAYMACKQNEKEQKMEESWDRIALTFWPGESSSVDEQGTVPVK